MPVLDTNYLIALEANEPAAVKWLEDHRGEEHHVPDFVAVEYLAGHSAPDRAWDALEGAFAIAHGTADWVRSTARFRLHLRRKRVRFRTPDFWIAAWARFLDTSVVTRDHAHFKDLDVKVEAW